MFRSQVEAGKSGVQMKIAIMLRGVDKQGGTRVYAKNLVPRMLELGDQVLVPQYGN